MTTSIIMTMIALAFVLVAAWLILRGVSSMGMTKSRGGRLEILETIAVGSRERIVMIRCDDKEYLIGVTANNIRQFNFEQGQEFIPKP
ncbi:MAG: flagellar biosynthetic protein FliO [Granulosicoccaceae bacterium]